jgi:hypothetical protein
MENNSYLNMIKMESAEVLEVIEKKHKTPRKLPRFFEEPDMKGISVDYTDLILKYKKLEQNTNNADDQLMYRNMRIASERMPKGIAVQDSFEEFVNASAYFLDRSTLISDIHNNDRINTYIFDFPTGWGKSLNMSMIYCYFNKPLIEEDTIKLFEGGNTGLFKYMKLRVMLPKGIRFEQPVLLLKFQELLNTDLYISLDRFIKELKDFIILKFEYQFRGIYFQKGKKESLADCSIYNLIPTMCDLILLKYKTKPYILIDNLNYVYQSIYKSDSCLRVELLGALDKIIINLYEPIRYKKLINNGENIEAYFNKISAHSRILITSNSRDTDLSSTLVLILTM